VVNSFRCTMCKGEKVRGFLMQLPPFLCLPLVRTSPITARPWFYIYELCLCSRYRCVHRRDFAAQHGGSQGWCATLFPVRNPGQMSRS